MSTAERRAGRSPGDRGFSLIEIVVAMGLLSVVLVSSLPVFVSMLRSTVTTRLNTQAKNLSQERLEQLRGLRFHVDRQNGPFLDLLDLYYTHSDPARVLPPLASPTGTLTGRYVASGSSNGVTAPFYETTTGPLPGAGSFSQVVVAQFLGTDGAVLPAARYQGIYDSQLFGRDTPPTLLVRMTVVTSWVHEGQPKSFRTTTVISEGRPDDPVIQTQAKAVAVTVGSTASDASTLQVQGGVATLDGGQSSGSTVSGYVTGAVVTRTGRPAVTGQLGQFVLPSQTATTSGSPGAQSAGQGCSWYGFGPNGVDNVTGDLTGGLPKAPANVDASTPPAVVTGRLQQGTGNGCGLLSFDNLADGGAARPAGDPLAAIMGTAPYATVPDGSSGGVAGSGYVTATSLLATPQESRSGARAAMGSPLVLFPAFPESGGRGLVSLQARTASVDCTSGFSNVAGTVVGRYELELGWWGRGPTDPAPRWHVRTWTYDSSLSTPLTATGDVWEPAATVLANGTTLDRLVTASLPSATEGAVTTGARTGLRGFPTGVATVTTAPTLANESAPGASAIRAQVGQVSCVADDQR